METPEQLGAGDVVVAMGEARSTYSPGQPAGAIAGHATGCGASFGMGCTCGPNAVDNPLITPEHGAVGQHGTTGNGGNTMGDESATLTRDRILSDWYAVINGPGLGLDTVEMSVADQAQALAASYEAATASATLRLGAPPYWAFISQEERDAAAKSGAARADGSYPILSCEGNNSVDTAIHAVGRGGADHDAIRRHIMKRADSLGCASKIPDNWNSDGSLKAGAATDPFSVTNHFIGDDLPSDREAMVDALRDPANWTEGTPVVFRGDHATVEAYLATFAAPPPPEGGEPEKAPVAPPAAKPTPDAPDAEVDKALDAIDAAIAAAEKAERADMVEDKETSSPVLAGLEALKGQMLKLRGTQGKDETAEANEPPEPATASAVADRGGVEFAPAAPGMKPGNAEGVPGDADDSGPGPGDIEATVECQNPNCGHLASAHADTDSGENSGACSMVGCSCPGMVPLGEQMVGPEDSAGPQGAADAPPPGAGEEVKAAAFAGGPEVPPVEGAPAAQLPAWDPEPNVVVGPPFTIPVAWIEGEPTGDGRLIEPGAFDWRTPPLPLMFLKTSPHDPSGMSPNDPAVLAGRIESVELSDGHGVMRGHFLATPDGQEAAEVLEQMGRMGVSVDVGGARVTVAPDPTLPPGVNPFDAELVDTVTQGTVMGATVCPFAAFAGCYAVLGDGGNVPEAELPPAPAEARMAIHFLDAGECVPCQASDPALPIVAAAPQAPRGPLAPPKAWFEDPGFHKGDARLVETFDPKSGRKLGKFVCPITVTPEGEVYGHVAQWGVCHQNPGFLARGECVLAPRSRYDYAPFHGTGNVLTAEGELIGVGRLTADSGHAPTEGHYGNSHPGMSFAQAVAHADNSGLTTAVVRAGEDEFGIWVHGALHPAASPEQVFTMRANPPSGDWRPWGASPRELSSVVFVNTPGFPMVRETRDPHTGQTLSLVAAGVPYLGPDESEERTTDDRLAAVELSHRLLAPLARRQVIDRVDALRG